MRFKKTCSAAIASLALCFGSTSAMASSCQAGGAGCLLPFQPVMATPVVQPTGPVAEPMIEESGGIGILPIILGLAAAGLLAWVLLDDDDEGVISV